MLNANNKARKYRKEALRLLEAIKTPKEVAVVHCQGIRRENQRLYTEIIWQIKMAKKAALSHEMLVTFSPSLVLIPIFPLMMNKRSNQSQTAKKP